MKSTERQAGQEQEGALVRIESTQQPKAEQLKSLGEKLRDALSSIKSKYSLYKESETAMVELRATNKIYEKVKDLSQLNRKATQFDQKAMSYAQLRVKEIDPKSKTANRVKIELSGIEGAISEIDSITGKAIDSASDQILTGLENGSQKLQELKKVGTERLLIPIATKGLELISNSNKAKDFVGAKSAEGLKITSEAVKNMSSMVGQNAQSGWNGLKSFVGKKVEQYNKAKTQYEGNRDLAKVQKIDAKQAKLDDRRQRIIGKYKEK